MKKQYYWLILAIGLTLLSGCFSRDVQNALVRQSLPYGLGAVAAPQGSPTMGYTSATANTSRNKTNTVANPVSPWGGVMGNPQDMSCLQNIDQAKMNQLAQEGEQFQTEIKQLCAQGLRDKAMAKAMAYGKKMANNPILKDLSKCGEAGKSMAGPATKDYTHHHICDSL